MINTNHSAFYHDSADGWIVFLPILAVSKFSFRATHSLDLVKHLLYQSASQQKSGQQRSSVCVRSWLSWGQVAVFICMNEVRFSKIACTFPHTPS